MIPIHLALTRQVLPALSPDNGDGTFGYDPNGGFESLAVGETATDTFTYTVTDNNGASTTNTVTVTIIGTNDAPIAGPAIVTSASEDVAIITVALLANSSDVDNGRHPVCDQF